MPRGTSCHALLPSRLPTEVQRAVYVPGMVRGDAGIERVDEEVRLGHHGVDHPGAHHQFTTQTTPRPACAAAPRVSGGSDELQHASDDGWAWPNQRRSRPNAAGQPSYRRRGSRTPPGGCRGLSTPVSAAERGPVRRTQALCLARSPPYDVCSRSDDLAGARIPPRPQQPSASTARARGSRTSWQVPRPTTENAKNRSYSTF